MAFKVYRTKRSVLGLLTGKQFFQRLADASGYMDVDTVKRVYDGLLRVIYEELTTKGALRLPALCDFHMLLAKERIIRNHQMPVPIIKPAHHQVRIRPMYTVRRYFKALDEANPGIMFDPAERLKQMEADGLIKVNRETRGVPIPRLPGIPPRRQR